MQTNMTHLCITTIIPSQRARNKTSEFGSETCISLPGDTERPLDTKRQGRNRSFLRSAAKMSQKVRLQSRLVKGAFLYQIWYRRKATPTFERYLISFFPFIFSYVRS